MASNGSPYLNALVGEWEAIPPEILAGGQPNSAAKESTPEAGASSATKTVPETELEGTARLEVPSGPKVLVTPLAAGRKPSPSRERTPSPPRNPPGHVIVTPVKGSQRSQSGEEVGAGSDDESHLEVVIRGPAGREHVVLAGLEGVALVPEEVLLVKLFGEGFQGSVTVRRENARAEVSPEWLDERFTFVLRPGCYVAEGLRTSRSGSRASGSSDDSARKRLSSGNSGLLGTRGQFSQAGSIQQRRVASVSVSRGSLLDSLARRQSGVSKLLPARSSKGGGGESEVSTPGSIEIRGREDEVNSGVGFKVPKDRKAKVHTAEKTEGKRKSYSVGESIKSPVQFRDKEVDKALQEEMTKGQSLEKLVDKIQPLTDLARAKRLLEAGRAAAAGQRDLTKKYGEMEFMANSPFEYVQHIVYPEQVQKGSGRIPCTFMMSTQGMGSGLGTAYRMSTPGKDLYGQTLYVDSQKVTTGGTDYLFQALVYSPTEKRILEIAAALLPSESRECIKEFCRLLKEVCSKGFTGEGKFAAVEPFEFSSFKISADAAGGIRVGWREEFPEREDGRNQFVECEWHWGKSLRQFEAKFSEEWMVKDHRKKVKKFLVAKENEREDAKRKLREWYDRHLGNGDLRKEAKSWSEFWFNRAHELGHWGLPEDPDFVDEELMVAGFINPTSNLAEVANAGFWVRQGGKKGGYPTPADVVQNQTRAALVQIAQRVEFERAGITGSGPAAGELRERAEERKRRLERDRQEGEEIEGVESERVKRTRLSVGVGNGGPVGVVRRGGEEGGQVTERSTHRHDQTRIERWPRGSEFRSGKKNMDLNLEPEEDTASLLEEDVEAQKRRWDELKSQSARREEMEHEEERREGGAGPWMQGRGEIGEVVGEERREERVEEGGEADDEEVLVEGEERYARTEWVIGRLDVDDCAACVGMVTEKDKCPVTVFSSNKTADGKGQLVFIKHGLRKYYDKVAGRTIDTGKVYMARLKMCAGGACNSLNGSMAKSEKAPDLDSVFGVAEGSDVTDEDVEELRRRGVKVDRSKVVKLEKGAPALPFNPLRVVGESEE
ncbi:hypothetical protein KFL_011670010 [Klebsormidium nitens]|uniref:Uncharacterized protein n=1 Tax=Klebsormidium nitens TaxID=105231 RepID=A0A1Y1IPR7_KLENI|nr:hypothetical protein KFL_011670010 [Klebsormidium nitens]|eukprot:GAQ92850.1 hypothetical protein KFL_011670010 [Klebsormidium nitens]